MRKIASVILLVSILISCEPQNKNNETQKHSSCDILPQSEINEKDSLITVEKLNQKVRNEWDNIFTHFLSKVYHPFFDQKNINFDCLKCEHVSMVIDIEIDARGKVLISKLVSDHIHCNKLTANDITEMKRVFMNYFTKITYPQDFFNKKIEFEIRPKFILKC